MMILSERVGDGWSDVRMIHRSFAWIHMPIKQTRSPQNTNIGIHYEMEQALFFILLRPIIQIGFRTR